MRFFNILSIIILFSSFLGNAQNENKIFDELKELADKQDYIQQPENSVEFTVRFEIDSLAKKIVNQFSEDPIFYSKIIGERIKHKLPEDKLPYTYIWALGITKNNEDIDLIIDCAKNDSSSELLSNAAFALSQFNDERCGKFILDLIKQNKAKDRFYYLHLLSAMQYESAIPYFDEWLKGALASAEQMKKRGIKLYKVVIEINEFRKYRLEKVLKPNGKARNGIH